MTSRELVNRLLWLLIFVALGLIAALIGVFFSGSQAWYLAIPAAVAVGWLLFANPTECESPAQPGRKKSGFGPPAP